MIVPEKNTVERSVGLGEGIETQIKDKNFKKLYMMLSDPYRDKIGSIVREITSNCFDSHYEAKVNDPVVVKMHADQSGIFISFVDVGVGLSPERIKKIYTQYLESTKEDDPNQIGYYGIGSKSPLSYTEAFHIITRYDGVEYHYIMHKGELKPKTNLLNSKPTTERNGTEIKIYLKSPGDKQNFIDAINKQLVYFDNVYFEGCGVQNDFKIYEGEHFLYRPNHQYSSYLHMVIGKVAYPIDFNILGIDPIKLPFALKFKIGEILVTPAREDVRYTYDSTEVDEESGNIIESEGTITIIKQRIELLREELKVMHNKQKHIFDTLNEYFIAVTNKNWLLIDGHRIKIDEFVDLRITKQIQYAPFVELGINVPSVWYFDYYVPYRLIDGTGRCVSHKRTIDALIKDKSAYYAKGALDREKNAFIAESYDQFIIKKLTPSLKNYKSYLNLKSYPKKDWRKIISTYQTAIDLEIQKSTKDYDAVVVTQEFKNSRKTKIVVNKREYNEILFYAYDGSRWNRRVMKENELKKYNMIVYGLPEERGPVSECYNLMNYHSRKFSDKKINSRILVLTAANKYLDIIKMNPNAANITEFKNHKFKITRQLVESQNANEFLNEVGLSYLYTEPNIHLVDKNLHELVERIKKVQDKTRRNDYAIIKFFKSIDPNHLSFATDKQLITSYKSKAPLLFEILRSNNLIPTHLVNELKFYLKTKKIRTK